MSLPDQPDDVVKKHLPQEPRALDVLAIEVAHHTLQGKNISQVAEATGWNRRQVRKLMRRPAFEDYLKEIDSHARAIGKTYVRNSISGLAPKIVQALEALLDKQNAKGVELALRTIGALEHEDADNKSSKPIQVFMPGAAPRVEKEVKREIGNE